MTGIFRSAADREVMLAYYDKAATHLQALAQWCDTRFGLTHVLVAGPVAAPPVLALHGWGSNALGMSRQIEGLSDAFRVYAPDAIGQGGRSADARPPLVGPGYADWLCDLLDGLGIDQARLIGLSGGGWLTLKLATRHSDRILRGVVVSPSGLVRPRLSLEAILATVWPILHPGPRSAAAFLRFASAPGWSPSPELLASFERFFRHVAVLRLGSQPVFTDDELRRIDVPLLILEGEHERLFSPVRAVARARAMIPGARGQIVSGVGHLMTEERPALVNGLIRDFLAG